MALLTATKRLLHSHPTITFLVGVLFGLLCAHLNSPAMRAFPQTLPPRTLASVRQQGVSHAPGVQKRVLAAYNEIPHIAQIAAAELRPGQVASENWHKDMVEMFIFTSGTGVLQLDGVNHSVSGGSFATVYPPTRHTIFNDADGKKVLNLFSIAAVR